MVLSSTLRKQTITLPLLGTLPRGGTAQTSKSMRDPDEAHYAKVIHDTMQYEMYLGAKSIITGPIDLSIVVYDHKFEEDPVTIIKLVMDALEGVCYLNDASVEDVTLEMKRLPKKYPGNIRPLPYILITCGAVASIRVDGVARGKLYSFYELTDAQRLAAQHEQIRHHVLSLLGPKQVHPIPGIDVEVEVAIAVNNTNSSDIDNVTLYYWETVKDRLALSTANIKRLRIHRMFKPAATPDEVTFSFHY